MPRLEVDHDGSKVVFFVSATDEHTHAAVAEMGFIKCEDSSIYISRLLVNEESRRKGIASQMINHLIELYPDRIIRLHVKVGNHKAQALYIKMGFVFSGKERGSVHLPMQRVPDLLLSMIGGAGERMPSPPPKGDLDIRISFSHPIPATQENWQQLFSTQCWAMLLERISIMMWALWGEHIPLDMGTTVVIDGKLWAVIFVDGKPTKLLPHHTFPQEYCIGRLGEQP
jgi:predicted GNAT family N-acyltransferase